MSVKASNFYLGRVNKSERFQIFAVSHYDWNYIRPSQTHEIKRIMEQHGTHLEISVLALIYIMKEVKG